MSLNKILGLIMVSVLIIGSLIAIYTPFPLPFTAAEMPIQLSQNSAIEKAKGLSYAVKELNLFSCLSIPEKTCASFFDRLYASTGTSAKTKTALMKALGHARQKEVFVFAANRFKIGSGYVLIDADATDEKIVNFLLENGEMR